MPSVSQILGKVYDSTGSIVESATVSLVHSSGIITETTNSSGEYILNLGNLTSWKVGDPATVAATKASKGTVSSSITLSSGGTTLNLTLSETSNLKYREVETNQYNMVFAVPTLFDGSNITSSNPLPVKSINTNDLDLINNPSHIWEVTNSDGQPESEIVTLANGNIYKRTFTYSTISGMRILTTRSKWAKQ